MTAATELTFAASPGGSPVSGLLLRPDGARLLYVLAHGAGAGMRHPFLESIAQRLAERNVATLRYQFPYMERRASRPDTPAVAAAAGRAGLCGGGPRSPPVPPLGRCNSVRARVWSTTPTKQTPPRLRGALC